MDAAASTIVHRYRRLLFPSPRPPVPLVRPLGPLLPLLTVGDLLFSKKKTYPNTCHLHRADTVTPIYRVRATNGIAAFERHFPPFVLYARDRRISRESGHKNESGPQPGPSTIIREVLLGPRQSWTCIVVALRFPISNLLTVSLLQFVINHYLIYRIFPTLLTA